MEHSVRSAKTGSDAVMKSARSPTSLRRRLLRLLLELDDLRERLTDRSPCSPDPARANAGDFKKGPQTSNDMLTQDRQTVPL